MTEQIHNLYISSTNKLGSDTNYNYNIYFSNYGIQLTPDDDVYFNITGFQTLNTFYNINSNSKAFSVKVKTDMDINFTYNFTIDEGNYNIFEFMEEVNRLCSTYFTMNYNEKKNKFNYTSKLINSTIYLMPNSNNYKYFGLNPNVFTEILFPINGIGTYSNIINMNNFSLVVIKVLGLIEENRTLDNFSRSVNRGDICALINRQDTNINALINWTDINNTFRKKICNTEINSLNFIFTDEFNNILYDLNDWLITLTISIKKKLNQSI